MEMFDEIPLLVIIICDMKLKYKFENQLNLLEQVHCQSSCNLRLFPILNNIRVRSHWQIGSSIVVGLLLLRWTICAHALAITHVAWKAAEAQVVLRYSEGQRICIHAG